MAFAKAHLGHAYTQPVGRIVALFSDWTFEIFLGFQGAKNQSAKYAFVNMSVIFMPSRQGVGNEFDVAKLRIYLQSAKQIAAFLKVRTYNFHEDTFIGLR